MASYKTCSAVSAACPVSATTYGYYPNLAGNTVLLVAFGLLFVAQVAIGLRRRVYSYSAVLAAGCLMEMLGYAGRVMMHANPWSSAGFQMQIVCIIIAPTFVAAGIYLTLKHVVRHNGPEYSRLRPELYTWIFIGCDIGSILLQATGGGIAGAAGRTNISLLNVGDWVIVAGISFQVATMALCGLLAVEYTIKKLRAQKLGEQPGGPDDSKAKIFQAAVAFAYVAVLIRCIYRVPEMAGGWGNPRMRNEKDFMALDGLMIVLAAGALTIFHPGYFYPSMATSRRTKSASALASSDEHEM
ncbi:putative RTA1 domain protein [Xylariales sp. PMI_506]|nr:putative RTA1 domain protein [Xylariales sp. PMI_506]